MQKWQWCHFYPFLCPCCFWLFFQLLSCSIICDSSMFSCYRWPIIVQPSYTLSHKTYFTAWLVQHSASLRVKQHFHFPKCVFLCSMWGASDAFCCLVVSSSLFLLLVTASLVCLRRLTQCTWEHISLFHNTSVKKHVLGVFTAGQNNTVTWLLVLVS